MTQGTAQLSFLQGMNIVRVGKGQHGLSLILVRHFVDALESVRLGQCDVAIESRLTAEIVLQQHCDMHITGDEFWAVPVGVGVGMGSLGGGSSGSPYNASASATAIAVVSALSLQIATLHDDNYFGPLETQVM